MDQQKLSLQQIISLIFLIGLLFFVYQNFYKEKNVLIKASEFDSISMDNAMRAAMLNSNAYNPAPSFLDPNIAFTNSFSGIPAYNAPTPATTPISMLSFNFSPSLPSTNNFSDYYSQAQALAENPSSAFSPSSFSLASSVIAYDPHVCPGFRNNSYPLPLPPNIATTCNNTPNCFWNSSDNICLKNCNQTPTRVICQSRFRYCKYLLKSVYSCVANYHDDTDNVDYQYTCGPAQENSDYCYPATYTTKNVCYYSSTSSGACAALDSHPEAATTCKNLKSDKAKCDLNSNCEWLGSVDVGCNGPSDLCDNSLTKAQCEAVTLPSSSNTCNKEKIGTQETCSNK